MSLGDEWSEATPGSTSKLNQVTVTYGTGAYLASLDKSKHKLLVCTSTGSGFTLDHVYLCSADGTTAIDLSDVNEHNHSSAGTGGFFQDVLSNNSDVLDTGGALTRQVKKSSWSEAITSTGSVSDVTGPPMGIRLATGATSGSTASIYQNAIEMDVSKRSFFKSVNKFGTASSVAVKFGYGMEDMAGADTNTRKYGFELCTTVSNNYFATSASGSARSSSDTGVTFSTSTTSFRAVHFPDLGTPRIDYYIDEVNSFSKTSNIPTAYANDEPALDNIFRFSVKNNTASDRTFDLYGVRFAYQTSFDWN